MGYQYVWIDGCRVEAHVAAAFLPMAAEFLVDTGCYLKIRDGVRTDDEQEREWASYVRRNFAPPTVARPGTSNHQESGPNGPRSLDLYDTGDTPGVTVFGTDRDAWMQRNAGRFGFENEGNNFGEAWHKTYRGSLTSPLPQPLAVPVQTVPEEDTMLALKIILPNGVHYATLTDGIFAGLIETDDLEWVKNVVTTDDKWTEVPDERHLQTLLHKHDVALDCYKRVGKDLHIRDSRTGVWSRGGRWSASGADWKALVDELKVTA